VPGGKGELGEKGERGLNGPQGPSGLKGETGEHTLITNTSNICSHHNTLLHRTSIRTWHEGSSGASGSAWTGGTPRAERCDGTGRAQG
jgi:hypothetical protein